MASQMIVHKEEIDFNELELYESDTLTISRRKFVSKISGAPIAESTPNVKEEPLCKPIFKIEQWYPYCNSYYSYTEGVDAFARVNHLLASKPPKTQFTSEEFEETEEKRKFQYSTRDAQIDYLETKPLSFLILGKPSIGEEELGRQLADYWHCVYIDPETLIKEEIESGSRAGQCIEFNLRCGRAIGIDVILRLVDKRIKTESVAHRGFVVCGLPVIPNDLYEEDPVSAESAVFTVQEIFEDILDAICDNKAPFTQTLLVSTPSRIHSVDDSQPFRTSRVEWGDPHWTLSYDKSYVEPSVNTSGKDDEKVSVPIADNMIPPDFGDSKQSICEPPEIARRVPVPDVRFDYLCEYFKPASKVPAFLNVVDIAGLVKGASEGQGLGNAFLSHISACDAIFHLCRAFEDDDVTHVEGEVDPVRDLEIINEELRLKDEETLTKALDKIGRVVERGADKKLKPEYDTLQKVKQVLCEEKNHIRFSDWDAKDIEILNKYLFLTSKPALYLVNLAEKDYIKKKNKWLIKIKEWVDKHDPGALIIPFSGAFEHKLVEEFEDPVLRKKFLEDNNVTSALDKIVVNGYKALQLEYFFTAGPDEVKAWTIQKGAKAPQAAGRIHTDFEKGFIMAEVMKFQDFKEEGSEAACKAAGKYRQQGRNYVVEDGDIIFFKFNAGAGLKDAKKK